MRPFHLAFPVHDLAAARAFYGDVLGCQEGRSSDRWIDFDLYGHQIVAHLDEGTGPGPGTAMSNPVDGHDVPVPHFGVVLTMGDWNALATRVEQAGIAFGIAPHAYLVQLRLARARQLLASGQPPARVAMTLGFADQSHMGRWFRRAYGLTPAHYRRRCSNLPDR